MRSLSPPFQETQDFEKLPIGTFCAWRFSDWVVAVTCMPLTLGAAIKGQWLSSDVICQIQGYVIQVWACFSLTIVALTAVNRYYRVVRPALYRKFFTKRLTMIVTTSSSLYVSLCR
ncbi:hypothetical protein OS493_032433 [Desmophyllum pertusum]|uniref:G-protein coupled receptors family 1 profile domain-containing protein n=1 Tax=Desmophyllum pertusum TaxID=174260 RepID=A0A9X0D7D2_9CNID|nr:hypothetical protein OS493_032433 [Desmophyllum pertusum]